MKLENIKLIIWDLDETFWRGTLSEEIIIPEEKNIQFVNDTLDMGIMHSICSKNDFETAKKSLISMNAWECFVFPSINWESKGNRIRGIIESMRLRPQNVVFIDDNVQNLEEAKFYCEGITAILPQALEEIRVEAQSHKKTDPFRDRLQKYRQMEEKEAARTSFSSNDEFLMSCNIRVEICRSCNKEEDRIHELILRSNQLNYTKVRASREELSWLIQDKTVDTGYIRVTDNFGDYGIVGFFAIKENKLLHFVFSCRTLGMRVEQYVYHVLGYPEIIISGEVAVPLKKDTPPAWINQKNPGAKHQSTGITKGKILLKGPCDMSQMYAFLGNTDNVVTEFTYMNETGFSVEGHNHTSQIVTALRATDAKKKEIVQDVDFFDYNMLNTALTSQKFDVVVLSMLTDGNLGVYRRKSSGEEIALCEKRYSLIEPANYDRYISGEVFTSGIEFTKENLSLFSKMYDKISNEDGELTVANLQVIWEHIGQKTTLVLLLGSEYPFDRNIDSSYFGRHEEHRIINDQIRKWSMGKSNVILLPYDKYIKGDKDFLDTINHFTKRVYYDLAQDLIKIVSEKTGSSVTVKGKEVLFQSILMQKLRGMKGRIIKHINI